MSRVASNPSDFETFEAGLQGEHIGLIAVVLSVSALVIFWVVGRILLKQKVRMWVLILALLWNAVVAVGLVAWTVTFTTMRDEVVDQVTNLIRARGEESMLALTVTLEKAPKLVRLMYQQIDHSVVNFTNMNQEPNALWLSSLESATNDPAITWVYYGLERRNFSVAGGPAPGVLYIGLSPGQLVPPDLTCPERTPSSGSWVDGPGCANYQCTGDAVADEACPASCLRWGNSFCPVSSESRLVLYEYYSRKIMSISNYNPTVRPWYRQIADSGVRGLVWSPPYPFSGGTVIGFTAMQGVYGPEGIQGVLAVDFTIVSISEMVVRLRPTPNSFVGVGDSNGNLLAHTVNLTEAGIEVPNKVVSTTENNITEVVRAFNLLYTRTTVAAIMARNSTMIYHADETAMFVGPVSISGFSAFVLITVPYDDVLHNSYQASKLSLLLVCCLSIACGIIVSGIVKLVLRPMGLLAQDMERVADMEVETLEGERKGLTQEIHSMNQSFQKMVGNLIEYKQYLPEALFVEEEQASLTEAPGRESGVATIVFTDIQDSTNVWDANPEAMRKALRLHNTVMRENIKEFDGYEVKTIGDAFMVAFETPVAALKWSMAVQEKLSEAPWQPDLLAIPEASSSEKGAWDGLKVRIGLHGGPVDIEVHDITGRCDYFGPVVNKAARISGKSVGGAVMIEDSFLDSAVSEGNITSLIRLPQGQKGLKGIAEPCNITVILSKKCISRRGYIENKLFEASEKERTGKDIRRKSEGGSDQRSVVSGQSKIGLKTKGKGRLVMVDSCTVVVVSLATENDLIVRDAAVSQVLLNEGLAKISSCLERSEGTLITAFSGAVVVGWNTGKAVTNHFNQSYRFCSLAVDALESSSCRIGMGASTGPCVTGPIGAGSGHRFVIVISPALFMGLELTVAARELEADALYAFATAAPVQAAKYDHRLRPVETRKMSKNSPPTIIYQLRTAVSSDFDPLDLVSPSVPDNSASWSWSPAYVDAFFNCDKIAIQGCEEYLTDPVLQKVVEGLKE